MASIVQLESILGLLKQATEVCEESIERVKREPLFASYRALWAEELEEEYEDKEGINKFLDKLIEKLASPPKVEHGQFLFRGYAVDIWVMTVKTHSKEIMLECSYDSFTKSYKNRLVKKNVLKDKNWTFDTDVAEEHYDTKAAPLCTDKVLFCDEGIGGMFFMDEDRDHLVSLKTILKHWTTWEIVLALTNLGRATTIN